MVDWSNNSSTDFQWVYALIKPLSAYGKEAHRDFQLFNRGQELELNCFLKKIEQLREYLSIKSKHSLKLQRLLKQIGNIDKQLEQISLGEVTDINLYDINKCCNLVKQIINITTQDNINNLLHYNIGSLDAVLNILSAGNKVDGSFYLADSYSPTLKSLRIELKECERELIKEKKINSQNIQALLGRRVNNSFTISKHDEDIISVLVNLSNVETVSQTEHTIKFLIKDNSKVAKLKQVKQGLEQRLYLELTVVKKNLGIKLEPLIQDISTLLKEIGYLDTLIARARVANELNCITPCITTKNVIKIKNARHPLLERKLANQGKQFTPRSIELEAGVSLITGINMGGKTVTLRLIELLSTMVHAGMPIPAESMTIGLRDYIHFSRSDEDSILTGLSHFGQEISQIKAVLKHVSDRGLVLIDEIAHGTSPVAGESLAIAVLERLHESNNIVIVTTHYTGISEKIPVFEWQTKGLNYEKWHSSSISNKEADIEMLSSYIDYSLVKVTSKKEHSEALKIAQLLGLDKDILIRAKKLVLESNNRLLKGGKGSE